MKTRNEAAEEAMLQTKSRFTRTLAYLALEAADAHDAAHGTHQVRLDDATVERAAQAMFAEEQCDRRQKLDVEGNWNSRLDDRDRDEYRRLTRAVLAAAVEAAA